MDAELVTLASAAAATVVTAMATDGWQWVRGVVARLLGRGDAQAQRRVLETLDEDAADLAGGGSAQELSVAWTGRLRDLLRADPQAADALRDLIADAGSHGVVSASGHGVAAGRDVYIQADGGVAAGVIHGSVNAPLPRQPGTD